MNEQPCFRCGKHTGGDLQKHHNDCSYVQELCEKYSQCKTYVNKTHKQWTRKGSRENAKHDLGEEEFESIRSKENQGNKLKPKRPEVFLVYSGFYGTTLPEYFVLEEEQNLKKGSVSYLVSDPRLPIGTPMRLQWFNASHFENRLL